MQGAAGHGGHGFAGKEMGKRGARRAGVWADVRDAGYRAGGVGAGRGHILGNRAIINTTNSSHKIICKNSKKGVDKRLLL